PHGSASARRSAPRPRLRKGPPPGPPLDRPRAGREGRIPRRLAAAAAAGSAWDRSEPQDRRGGAPRPGSRGADRRRRPPRPAGAPTGPGHPPPRRPPLSPRGNPGGPPSAHRRFSRARRPPPDPRRRRRRRLAFHRHPPPGARLRPRPPPLAAELPLPQPYRVDEAPRKKRPHPDSRADGKGNALWECADRGEKKDLKDSRKPSSLSFGVL